jgi:hypothetical protein
MTKQLLFFGTLDSLRGMMKKVIFLLFVIILRCNAMEESNTEKVPQGSLVPSAVETLHQAEGTAGDEVNGLRIERKDVLGIFTDDQLVGFKKKDNE